jgi:threonine/homoserine/homoserine lactone efflux protein
MHIRAIRPASYGEFAIQMASTIATVIALWPAVVGGIVYVLTPGPGFLAMLSSVSVEPLGAGIRFAAGLLAGSAAWLVFTLATLRGAGALPAGSLELLAVVCAAYLAYLGTRLILASAHAKAPRPLKAPLCDGLLLSATNPKAYPVLTAVFGALVLADTGVPAGVGNQAIFLAGVLGFAVGYAAMLGIARAPAVRAFYTRHRRAASAVIGGVFWLFALDLVLRATGAFPG